MLNISVQSAIPCVSYLSQYTQGNWHTTNYVIESQKQTDNLHCDRKQKKKKKKSQHFNTSPQVKKLQKNIRFHMSARQDYKPFYF